MTSAMPALRAQLALTGSAYTGANWVTIGPFVLGFDPTRGRQHELQRPEAGMVTLRLSNRDGRFNPWSKNSPYYNQLPATDSNPTSGVGTWTASGATLGRVTSPVRYGSHAWSLTATSAGNLVATSDSHTAAVPGRTYTAVVWAEAHTTARAVKVSIVWKTTAGTVVSTTTGGTRNDSTSGWGTTPWTVRGVCPTGAVKKDVKVTIVSAATAEVHYVACVGIFDVTYVQGLAAVSQGWCVGQQKPLWPAQPIRFVATWTSTTYPIFAGCVDKWTPVYGKIAGDMHVQAHDYMHLWANSPVPETVYVTLVTEAGPTIWWRLQTPTGSSSAKDSSGNGHTGTVTASGSGASVAFGKPGKLFGTATELAVELTASYTTTAKIAATLAMPSAWTVELIVKATFTPSTSYASCPIVTWGTGSDSVGLDWVHGPITSIQLTHGGSLVSGKETTVTPGTWYYVAITKSSGGSVTVWVNSLTSVTGPVTETSPKISGATYSTLTGSAFSVGGTSTLTIHQYMSEVAVYSRVLTDTTIAQHRYAWATGYPNEMKSGALIKTLLLAAGVPSSALGTITTGTITCKPPRTSSSATGETQLLSVLQTIEFTEQGMLFCTETGKARFYSRHYIYTSSTANTSKGTIADDGTPSHYAPAIPPIPALDDLTLFNVVTVGIEDRSTTTSTSYVVTLRNPTSVKRYGARLLTGYTGMHFANDGDAYDLAVFLVEHLATPLPRVRQVTLASYTSTGANLPQMLGRKLLDSVTVWWQPKDGSASPFTQKAQIEQIMHKATKERWVTTWVLAIPA